MKSKKIATSVAAMGMVVASALPVMAAEPAALEVNPSQGQVPVTLEVTSNYTVTLPAAVTLEYEAEGTYEAEPVFASDYDITVKGHLADGFGLEIKGSDVDMFKGEGEAAVKAFTAENYMDKANTADKDAKKTVFVSGATEEGVTTANRIEHKAAGVDQGTYTGTAAFTYKLVSSAAQQQ